MNSEIAANQNWLKRNWKWLLAAFLVAILLFTIVISSTSKNDLANISQAYAENSLFEKAIEKANTNKRVLETTGKISPLDKLAILEGNTIYSNNNKSVKVSVRVQGSKSNGKLDISADKKGEEWEYNQIIIRSKNPKEEIIVLH